MIYFIEQDDVASWAGRLVCPQQGKWFDAGGVVKNQPVDRRLSFTASWGRRSTSAAAFSGSGGRAKEAQSEFLVLIEDSIRQPDLAKSVQRYQLAVDEAKVRLNLAVAPNSWLMPARDDNQHPKHSRLQQQAEAGGAGDEAWGEQRGESRHKKSGAETNGRRPVKNKPAQQPSFQPDSKGCNS